MYCTVLYCYVLASTRKLFYLLIQRNEKNNRVEEVKGYERCMQSNKSTKTQKKQHPAATLHKSRTNIKAKISKPRS